MVLVDLLLFPNLKTSSMKAAYQLKERGCDYDVVLLNAPVEMEELVMELVIEQLSIDELFDEVGRLHMIPEPWGSWFYSMRPILESLPLIAKKFPSLMIGCYGSRDDAFASMEVSVRIASLILRMSITGEMELEKWREILQISQEVNREATERDTNAISLKAGERTICLSDLGGRRLQKPLGREGLYVKPLYVEKPYHFNPLTILKRRMARGPVGDGELEELVRCHLEYVKNYIYRFRNRDRAHYEWEYDKIPLLRGRIDKRELQLLDGLISEDRSHAL